MIARKDINLEHIGNSVAEGTTYVGATSAAFFWGLSIGDVGVIVSMAVAVLGFIVHIWLSIRRERRAIERHRATMEKLREPSKTD